MSGLATGAYTGGPARFVNDVDEIDYILFGEVTPGFKSAHLC